MNTEKTIEDYKEWVNKSIPINSDWIDEINYISHIRQEIHECRNQLTKEQLDEVKDLDDSLITWCSANVDKNFKYTDKPPEFTESTDWWWNLDKF